MKLQRFQYERVAFMCSVVRLGYENSYLVHGVTQLLKINCTIVFSYYALLYLCFHNFLDNVQRLYFRLKPVSLSLQMLRDYTI